MDAAIASLLCNGLVNSHSMGIGGGSFWTIYLKDRGEMVTLNARETAPAASTTNMYLSNPSGSSGRTEFTNFCLLIHFVTCFNFYFIERLA